MFSGYSWWRDSTPSRDDSKWPQSSVAECLYVHTSRGATEIPHSHEHLHGVAACVSTASRLVGASLPVMVEETQVLAIEKQQNVNEGARNLQLRDQPWVDRRSVHNLPNSVVMRIKEFI